MTKHNRRDLIPIYIGLSSEDKPTGETVEDGSQLYELDTQKSYTYDAANAQWEEGSPFAPVDGGGAGKIVESSSGTVTLSANSTTVISPAPTAVSVTLPTPVDGADCLCGLIFTAGASMTFADTAPTGYAVKWDSNPTWTAGKVYEIIYRCLWVTDSNDDVIISAKWSEI